MPPDGFVIERPLGEGGFARVFKARETATGRTVALKVLKESLRADAEVLERFRREIFAVASIDSPYVVRLYDFGVAGGDSFLAMEYVEGTSLRELMRGKPWSATDVHVIVGQLCQALGAAHKVGIIHRDIKPENIMLVPGRDGTRQVKVLDFGFAKLLDLERQLDLEPLTQVGMCFGTPQYMSPEQMQGRAVDASVDLYAAAVIAYEMLAGELPWDGHDARDVFRRVMSSPPPPITRPHATVTRVAELDQLMQRALAKPKRLRPATAEALFSMLEVALFGAPQSRGGGAFSSVLGKTISVPDLASPSGRHGDGTFGGGTFGGPTDVDTSPGPHLAKVTPRHLKSGWQRSLPPLPGVALPTDENEPPTLERAGRAAPRAPAEVASAARRSPGLWLWVVLAVLLAGAIGYFAGTLRH